jgi:hypothetical protein
MVSTVAPAALSHLERVDWAMPTSRARAEAERALGPHIFATMDDLNFFE